MERENKKYSLELTERASKKDYKDRVNVSIDTFTSPWTERASKKDYKDRG